MNFAQFISVLRARWKVALAVLLLTAGATLVISLLLPKQYLATASVVVDSKPDPLTALANPAALMPSYLQTQVDVIQSDRVSQKVVRNLKLTENPQIREQWQDSTKGQGSIETWMSETLQKKLEVKPSRESNVINISYRSPDPRFAAGLANAYAKAFLEVSVELRVDPARQYSSFFDERAKAARETLEKAQTALSAFQRNKGIVASDERLDVENARLNELSSQMVGMQAVATESGSRQTAAGTSGDKMQEVLNNQVVAGLKTDLARAEARLEELNARYGSAHPQVIEAKANAAETRSRLEAETRRITSGVTLSNEINQRRLAELRSSIESQRSKLLQLKAVRDDGAVLIRDVESAQRAYDAVLARLTQTSLESLSTQSNVNMLSEASPPLEAAGPKVILNTLISAVLGAFLGIAAALILELMDRRVRSVEDLAESIGLPVIGVLPANNVVRRGMLSNLLPQRRRLALPAPRAGA